jgi:hypothetical protein
MAHAHPPVLHSRAALTRALLLALGLCLALAAPLGAAADDVPALLRRESPPTSSVRPPSGPMPADTLYLAQTGHYLRGTFLNFWLANDGATRFGYPLSEAYLARGADGKRRLTQLFDRARFELHGDGNGNWHVALGQLGREALGGQTFPPVPAFAPTDDRAHIAATGHSLANGFLAYWLANDGERILGYPLSEELAVGGRVVQHFERGRLEFDPATGALGPAALGQELLVARGWPRPSRISLTLSLPSPGQGQTTIAELFADRPLTVLSARLDDRTVTFFGGDIYHRAFIGLGPDTPVGAHMLTVELRDADGAKTLTIPLSVRETPFPRDRVYLPPDQGGLLDPAVAERELRIVMPLYAIYTPAPLWSGPFIMPAQGPITTEFGEIRAYNDGPFNSWHNGLDIGAPHGAPIVAPAPGRVVYAGALPIRGNFTAIDHGLGILTCYFHQSEILVAVGQTVQTGDLIGRVGTTGLSTGAHLHWEVRVQGIPVNPWQWMQGAGVR